MTAERVVGKSGAPVERALGSSGRVVVNGNFGVRGMENPSDGTGSPVDAEASDGQGPGFWIPSLGRDRDPSAFVNLSPDVAPKRFRHFEENRAISIVGFHDLYSTGDQRTNGGGQGRDPGIVLGKGQRWRLATYAGDRKSGDETEEEEARRHRMIVFRFRWTKWDWIRAPE